MTFQAVLFDLDGTLVDSEPHSAAALAAVLGRDHGITMTPAQREFVLGHSWNEIYARLATANVGGLRWSQEDLAARVTAERARIIAEKGLPLMPGAREAFDRLGAGRQKAIVTGSSHDEARQALTTLGALMDFPIVIASEDYSHGKPAPDGYLLAARRLAVPPAACLVLEDSAPGIAAGRAAGMTVVAVSAGNFLGQDQSAAHRIVATLNDVTLQLLAELAPGGQ